MPRALCNTWKYRAVIPASSLVWIFYRGLADHPQLLASPAGPRLARSHPSRHSASLACALPDGNCASVHGPLRVTTTLFDELFHAGAALRPCQTTGRDVTGTRGVNSALATTPIVCMAILTLFDRHGRLGFWPSPQLGTCLVPFQCFHDPCRSCLTPLRPGSINLLDTHTRLASHSLAWFAAQQRYLVYSAVQAQSPNMGGRGRAPPLLVPRYT